MEAFWTYFLNEHFWLPANITWADFTRIEQEENVKLTNPNDLLYAFPLAALIYVIRILFERYIAKPIGRFVGIRDTTAQLTAKKGKDIKKPAQSNPSTETVENQSYKRQSLNSRSKTSSSAKRSSSDVSRLTKFNESCWRFTFYLSAFIYGVIVLRHKLWTWDTSYCWLGFPNQPVTPDIFWYYMIELAFYWSLLFSQFFDIKRKDFWQMFLHHLATIALLSFSYIANYVRVGSLVLVIHDCADYWLESAKMGVYARSKRCSDTLFVIFTLVWFITRICYFPYKILYTTLFEGVSILGSCPAYYVFNGLLMILYALHCFWFYLICLTAISALKTGEVSDERSESEDNNDDDKDK